VSADQRDRELDGYQERAGQEPMLIALRDFTSFPDAE
jgi:hypothetical protein